MKLAIVLITELFALRVKNVCEKLIFFDKFQLLRRYPLLVTPLIACSLREHRVYLRGALNRIGLKSCVEVGKLESTRRRFREETQARTFISQITTDAGSSSSTPGAKGNLWSRSKSYIDVGSIADKCPRFQENPLSRGEDIGCFLKRSYIFYGQSQPDKDCVLYNLPRLERCALLFRNCFLRK